MRSFQGSRGTYMPAYKAPASSDSRKPCIQSRNAAAGLRSGCSSRSLSGLLLSPGTSGSSGASLTTRPALPRQLHGVSGSAGSSAPSRGRPRVPSQVLALKPLKFGMVTGGGLKRPNEICTSRCELDTAPEASKPFTPLGVGPPSWDNSPNGPSKAVELPGKRAGPASSLRGTAWSPGAGPASSGSASGEKSMASRLLPSSSTMGMSEVPDAAFGTWVFGTWSPAVCIPASSGPASCISFSMNITGIMPTSTQMKPSAAMPT
mmetsp:Transcript_11842/g.33462  ORF Transcript_11842/g.33462 Transcript_11842/m.33462 type:complete len:262 (-) Transcript_11842:433-1218(-)